LERVSKTASMQPANSRVLRGYADMAVQLGQSVKVAAIGDNTARKWGPGNG
jgi:hypothetical protein